MAEKSNDVLVVAMRRWNGMGSFLGHEGTPGTDSYSPMSIEFSPRSRDSQQPNLRLPLVISLLALQQPLQNPRDTFSPFPIFHTSFGRYRVHSAGACGDCSAEGSVYGAVEREGSYREGEGGTGAFVCKGISIYKSSTMDVD